MKPRIGRFSDPYRGNGWMISFPLKRGWLLFGLRPLNWHLYFTRVYARPAFRLYAGPFEVEFYWSATP